ncbi:MAG: hypothetical protein ACRD3G_09275 [Vicinamibacterales bacterium]
MRRSWMRTFGEHLHAVRLLTRRFGLHTMASGLVIVTTVSACEGWGPHDTVTSPLADPSLIASISVPIISTSGEATQPVRFIPFRCSSGAEFTGPLDITMTAGSDVELHEVRIRLAGTSFRETSGSSIQAGNSFDSDDLASVFGTNQIPGGTVRTFRFRTDLSCGPTPAEFVAADIEFTEVSGRRNSITVTAPFGSEIGSDF